MDFATALGFTAYVKRPTPIEGDWRLSGWEFPCLVLMPSPTAEYVRQTSGTTEVRDFDILDLRATDVTFDTAEADSECELARVELLQFVQRLSEMFHVEQRAGRQIWDSANGGLVVGWSVSLRLTELVGLSACDGLPIDPKTMEITENGTYNVLPFGRAVVDVQGGSPAVIEPLSVTPDYDPHTFTPPAGVDGFAPVEVAACPIPETDVLNVTPDNEPHQYLPEHGIGFSVVNVAACPACPVPDVRPLSVTPSRNAQTFSPSGFDGFAPVEVQGYTPVLQAKTATPATTAQVVTADGGYDGLSSVSVDAVTASIDENIQAGNIKKDVEILGVVGTLEPMPTGDRFVLCNQQSGDIIGDFVTNSQLTRATNGDFGNQVVEAYCYAITESTSQAIPNSSSHLKKIVWPSCSVLATSTLMTTPSNNVEYLEFGVITSMPYQFVYSFMLSLRHFEVGQDTAISLDIRRWTATNVIAEGQTGIDELNYNIKTYIADKVADRTGDSALTITFGASLYNVLTPATIAAFTAKNWSVASA